MLRSIFTDSQGKHAAALYMVEVTGERSEMWIAGLLPTHDGWRSAAGNIERLGGKTRWLWLVTNRQQTTREDVVRVLAARAVTATVRTLASVPERGHTP